MKLCDTSQGGYEAVKKAVIKLLGGQSVERNLPNRLQTVEGEVQTDGWLAIEQDALWHPNAMIVCADVGSETDNHECKLLMVPADTTKKPPKLPCKDTNVVLTKVANHSKELNAMLNHQSGVTVYFGIQTTPTQWRRGWNSTRQISLMSCKLGLVNYCRSSILQFRACFQTI